MPAAGVRKLKPAPTGVLLDTLSDLVERPGQEPLAYFLSLLLVRRGTLVDETQTVLAVGDPNAHTDTQEKELTVSADLSPAEATEYWQLVCKADGRGWNVPIVEPTGDEMIAIEEQLNHLLFTEQ